MSDTETNNNVDVVQHVGWQMAQLDQTIEEIYGLDFDGDPDRVSWRADELKQKCSYSLGLISTILWTLCSHADIDLDTYVDEEG